MSTTPTVDRPDSGAPADGPEAAADLRGPHTYRWVELVLILVAVAISAVAYVLVGIGTQDKVPANVYEYTIWLLILSVTLHVVTWIRAKYADPILMPVAVLLNGLGLAMIFRMDQATLTRENPTNVASTQLIWMTLGCVLAAAVIIFLRDHRILRRWTYIFGLAGLLLLLLPMVPGLGRVINGARIWIHVGPMSFQPGEISKILMAIFFAGYFVAFRDQLALAGPKVLGLRLPRLRDMGPLAIAWAGAIAVLVLERDLGTALLFFGLFVAMLYVATGIKTWIVIGLVAFGAGAFLASKVFAHVGQRVDGWLHALDPEQYDKQFGGSYQLVQGMFGMANGGMAGSGLGAGRPQMVPFANSDFIYASLGEELGLVGLFAILLLFVVFVQRGLKISVMLRDGFGKLLAAGLSFTVALQVFIVVGGVTRLIPLTGLTLPFMAAGGSSLISNWIILALLLRMSDSARRPLNEIPAGVLRPAPATDENPVVTKKAADEAVAKSGVLPAVGSDSAFPDDGGYSNAGIHDAYQPVHVDDWSSGIDPEEGLATAAHPLANSPDDANSADNADGANRPAESKDPQEDWSTQAHPPVGVDSNTGHNAEADDNGDVQPDQNPRPAIRSRKRIDGGDDR